MEVDKDKADEWYNLISEFLESRSEDGDIRCPNSLIIALCRVLADTIEGVSASNVKRLEAVIRLTAASMGYEDVLLLFGKDAKSININ